MRQWIFNNPALSKPTVAMIGVNPGVTGIGSSNYADDYTLNDIGKMIENLTGQFESYMEIDASKIQIRDYRDVLSDVVLPHGMTMNDAVETLNEIAESWRNGGLTTKADVMNEIHVQLNVDGEKLAEITDRVLGKNYAD